MEYTVKYGIGLEQVPEARQMREEIFVREQGFANEFDDVDGYALHMVIFVDGIPAATGRLYQDATGCHIGRVAVTKAYRGQKLGELVMEHLEDEARRQQADRITLSAQVRARGFYEKLGYTGYGEIYMDEFCPHIAMEKAL